MDPSLAVDKITLDLERARILAGFLATCLDKLADDAGRVESPEDGQLAALALIAKSIWDRLQSVTDQAVALTAEAIPRQATRSR